MARSAIGQSSRHGANVPSADRTCTGLHYWRDYHDKVVGSRFLFSPTNYKGDVVMDTPIWLWIGFNVFVLAMLALDLGVFHRKSHAVSGK